MPTILLVGADEMLLKTRAAVLSRTDSEVVTTDAQSALAIQEARKCELVVLCHSMDPEICAKLAELIRARWPHTRILQVISDRVWGGGQASAAVDAITFPDPDVLLGKTTELLQRVRLLDAGEIFVRGGVVRSGSFVH
jgi:DNA-binding response OmpR family regulator